MRRGLKLTASFNPSGWLRNSLESMFETLGAQRWDKPRVYLRPSSIVHSCKRKFALDFLGYRGAVSGDSLRRMDNGTKMHERWTEYFKRIPEFVGADVPVRDKAGTIVGTADIMLRKTGGEQFVGEIKSINSFGYRKLGDPKSEEENLTMLTTSYPGYVAQILTYMRYAGKGTNHGFFLFENKDTQEYKIFFVKRNDALLDELIQTGRTALDEFKETHELPDPPFEKSSLECKACNNRVLCFALQDGARAETEMTRETIEAIFND